MNDGWTFLLVRLMRLKLRSLPMVGSFVLWLINDSTRAQLLAPLDLWLLAVTVISADVPGATFVFGGVSSRLNGWRSGRRYV